MEEHAEGEGRMGAREAFLLSICRGSSIILRARLRPFAHVQLFPVNRTPRPHPLDYVCLKQQQQYKVPRRI